MAISLAGLLDDTATPERLRKARPIQADATRIDSRYEVHVPEMRRSGPPPLGNALAQIMRGLEMGVIEGTPLDPGMMPEDAPIRGPIEDALNFLRGPLGPEPGEGVPGLEMAALIGAGAVTPGPGEYRNIVGFMANLAEDPTSVIRAVMDDAPAVERMLRAADEGQLDDLMGTMVEYASPMGEQIYGQRVSAAARALFHRAHGLFSQATGRVAERRGSYWLSESLERASGRAADEVEWYEAALRSLMGGK